MTIVTFITLQMICLQFLQIISVSQIHPQLLAESANFRLWSKGVTIRFISTYLSTVIFFKWSFSNGISHRLNFGIWFVSCSVIFLCSAKCFLIDHRVHYSFFPLKVWQSAWILSKFQGFWRRRKFLPLRWCSLSMFRCSWLLKMSEIHLYLWKKCYKQWWNSLFWFVSEWCRFLQKFCNGFVTFYKN